MGMGKSSGSVYRQIVHLEFIWHLSIQRVLTAENKYYFVNRNTPVLGVNENIELTSFALFLPSCSKALEYPSEGNSVREKAKLY